MLADSSFGAPGDEATMTFSLPYLGSNHALSFDYMMNDDDHAFRVRTNLSYALACFQ